MDERGRGKVEIPRCGHRPSRLRRPPSFLVLSAMITACSSPQEPTPEPPPPIEAPEPVQGLQLEVVTVQGQQFLRHPQLGFLLSHPGAGFEWSQEVEERTCSSIETDLSVECHALFNASTGMTFTVQVNQIPSADPESFHEFHAGLLEGLGEATEISEQGMEVDDEGRPFSRILALANGPGVSVYAQTHPFVDTVTQTHYAISVFVYGSDPQGMTSLDITYHVP